MNIRFSVPAMLSSLLMALIFISCTSTTKQNGKPRSSGTTSEILVVTDSKAAWEGSIGDTIRHWFSQPIPALPQKEQSFDMLNVSSKNFNDLFKKYHNILIVNLEGVAEGSSTTSEDVWSIPQRVITIKAPDEKTFFEEFDQNKRQYFELFTQLERKRIEVLNTMSDDIKLEKRITDKFHIFMSIPGGFYLANEAPGFMWLRHTVAKGKQDVELGILIYTTDYKDTTQLSPKYILNYRNIISRQHVPGPTDGSYMTVSADFIPPVVSYPQDFPVDYVVETRGLWKVENDFMGGPFLNFTFVDPKQNQLISIDGYVYNPNEFKRNYMRQLESIFYTLKFTD